MAAPRTSTVAKRILHFAILFLRLSILTQWSIKIKKKMTFLFFKSLNFHDPKMKAVKNVDFWI